MCFVYLYSETQTKFTIAFNLKRLSIVLARYNRLTFISNYLQISEPMDMSTLLITNSTGKCRDVVALSV